MPCPDLHTIKALLGGDDSISLKHSEHIRHCSKCQSQLDRLAEDPELQSWRDALTSSPPRLRSDECDRLVKRLRTKETEADGLHAQLSTPASGDEKRIIRTLEPGSMVDHFRIVGELGRGGMSMVLEAVDTRLNRPVALKLMLGPTLSNNARARFVREATAVSSIQHPNVVSVFGAEYEGINGPYLAMELIRGSTLREWIANGNGFRFKDTALLIAQVADGLSAAHRAGVLHRDIKPSNILITDRSSDEVASRNAMLPKLADFGLALPMDVDTKLTLSGVLTGTPVYASPEQITAPESIGQQSDVYSLGVTLYEALTGTVPFHGSTQNVLKQIVEAEYVAPRRLNREIPQDLETICMKAMGLSANQRYQTAQAFGADLRRWLAGEPIAARPSSAFEKTARWAARNPRTAGLLALVASLLIAIVFGSTYAAFTINETQKELMAETVKVKLASEAAEKSAIVAMDQRELALDSLNELINGVQTQLSGRAGTLKLREELLRTAASGLMRIAEGADASRLEQTTIDAHQQLAKIHTALGETAEAKKQTQQAIELCESAIRVRPDDINLKKKLADSLSLEADFHRNEFALDKVEEVLKQVLDLREAVATSVNDQDSTRRLNIVKQQLADIAWKRGDLAASLSAFEKCAEVAKALHDQRPEEEQLIRDLYILHNRIASVLGQQNKPKESEKNFEISRGYCELLLKLNPDNKDYQSDSAYVLSRIARMKLNVRELSTAHELARRSIERYEAVAAQDLEDVRAQSLVGSAHSLDCEIVFALGDFESARIASQGNIDIQMRLAKLHPDTSKYCLLASQSFAVFMDIELRQGNLSAAIDTLHTIGTMLESCLQSIDAGQSATVKQVSEYYKTIESGLSLIQAEQKVSTDQLNEKPTIARCAAACLLYEHVRSDKFDRVLEAASPLDDLSMVSTMHRDFIEMTVARTYALAYGKLSSKPVAPLTADSPDASAVAMEYKQKCIAMCREMTMRNPQLRQFLSADPDFNPVRADDEFQLLLND